MKRQPLALVWQADERIGPGSRWVPAHQELLGKSIFGLVIDAVQRLSPRILLAVLGDINGDFRETPLPAGVRLLKVRGIKGAIGAVLAAGELLSRHKTEDLILLNARLALISPRSLRSLLAAHRRGGHSLTMADSQDPLPLLVARIGDLLEAIGKLGPRQRSSGRVDALINLMAGSGLKIGSHRMCHPEESLSVGAPAAFSRAARFLRERKISDLESKGVIVLDPATTWIDLDVRIGRGTVLYPSVVIEGQTTIGPRCRIYPFVHLRDASLGSGVNVLSSTDIEKSRVEQEAQVGPFSRLRPMTVVRRKAKVGNFVEMKNTVFGKRSRAGHLSYLGDADVGEGVNIGAGTITCNYDGFRKSRTTIGNGAFIGSGTELVAPVRVGRDAYVGAGSVITRDVPPDALAVARGRQVEKPGWVRRKRKRKR